MATAVMCFQVHQPMSLQDFRFSQIGFGGGYTNDGNYRKQWRKAVEKQCLPTLNWLGRLSDRFGKDFRVAFYISGTALDHLEAHEQETLSLFQQAVSDGLAEILAGTFYHSLSGCFSLREFARQAGLHAGKVNTLFGKAPRAFVNPRLLASRPMADTLHGLGFKTMLADASGLPSHAAGALPGWHPLSVLPVALVQYPTPGILPNEWVRALFSVKGPFAHHLFMPLELLSTDHSGKCGLFKAFETEIEKFIGNGGRFATVSDAVGDLPCDGNSLPQNPLLPVLNNLQSDALERIYSLEKKLVSKHDTKVEEAWEFLQSSCHFDNMAFHGSGDPSVSPYDAYIAYMNILSDLEQRLGNKKGVRSRSKSKA